MSAHIMKHAIVLVSVISLVIASIWMYTSNFDYEPILAVLGIAGLILGYFIYDNLPEKSRVASLTDITASTPRLNNNPIITVNPIFKFNESLSDSNRKRENKGNENSSEFTKDQKIDLMKQKINILFVDDDAKFNLVKILKDSGWCHTSTIKDIKSIDMPQVRNAHVLFIDIHGVGKLLHCKFEGLDLAQMVKQKYPEKTVVIYSAERQGDIFHEGIKLADYILEKNALPYQFQVIVEQSSVAIFENK